MTARDKYKARCRAARWDEREAKEFLNCKWADAIKSGTKISVCPTCHHRVKYSMVRCVMLCVNVNCLSFGKQVTAREHYKYWSE